MAAATGIPEKENKMEKQPEIRLQQVMAFGICCFRRILSHSFQGANPIFMLQRYQINTWRKTIHQTANLNIP